MFHLLCVLFVFVGSAFAVDPTAPLAPGTFVIGTLPPGLSPACRQGVNKWPFFVAPALPGRVEVGETQVWTAPPNQGGKMIVVRYNGDLVSVIPPAEVTNRDGTGKPTGTAPIRFWYCLDAQRVDFGGKVLSGPNTMPSNEGLLKMYLGNFFQKATCGKMFVDQANPAFSEIEYNNTRCQ